MKRSEAFNAIGSTAKFRRDRAFASDGQNTYYNWREGDSCEVIGFMQAPNGTPHLLVSYGEENMDLEEIELCEVREELILNPAIYH